MLTLPVCTFLLDNMTGSANMVEAARLLCVLQRLQAQNGLITMELEVLAVVVGANSVKLRKRNNNRCNYEKMSTYRKN